MSNSARLNQVDRQPRQQRLTRAILGIVLLGYVVIALSYVITVPIWEEVDEAGHFAYVKYLRDHHDLPYQPDDARQLVLSHWFHPVLYYAVGALVTAGIDISDFPEVARPNPHFEWVQGDSPGGWNVYLPVENVSFPPHGTVLAVYLLRLLSVAIGLGTLFIAYLIGRLLLPGLVWISVAAVGATAFNPSFAYMSAGAHNDTLTTLLGAAVVWWSCRLALGDLPTWRGSALGGLLFGLALLTKTSTLALVPVVVLALVVAAAHGIPLHDRSDLPRIGATIEWRKLARATAVSLGVAFVVSGWWYVRNIVIYGDPVAWQRYLVTHAFLVRNGTYTISAFRDFADQLAHTYWAAFGYMNLVVDRPIYVALWAISAIAALGLGRVAWLVARNRGVGAEIRRTLGGWLVATFAVVVYVGSLVRYSMTLGGVGHGRLIFPILPIASLLLVIGLFQVVPRPLGGVVVASTVTALAVLAAACPYVYIRPAYSIPSPLATGLPSPASIEPLKFGDSFRLVDLRVDPARVTAGANTTVHFFWQSTISGGADLLVTTRLRDRFGAILYQKERRPLSGHLPTDRWIAGSIYDDAVTLDVPAQAYSGSSPIEVSVRPFNGGLLGATDDRSAALGTVVTLARVAVVGEPVAGKVPAVTTGPSQIVDARLGDWIELRGFDLNQSTVHPGESLRFVLYWRALGPIATNYTVFTHVADQSGRPIAQTDSEPLNRVYPTSDWQPSEEISDPYTIVIPSSTPLGRYRLLVGMYDHVSGARLPIATSSSSVPRDAIELTTVVIQG